MAATFIVKLQLPLGGTQGADLPALVYTKDRTAIHQLLTVTPEMIMALDGDVKGYFNATVQGAKLVLLERVEDQNW